MQNIVATEFVTDVAVPHGNLATYLMTTPPTPLHLHTEKSILNLVDSNQIRIVITIFR